MSSYVVLHIVQFVAVTIQACYECLVWGGLWELPRAVFQE